MIKATANIFRNVKTQISAPAEELVASHSSDTAQCSSQCPVPAE